MGHGAWGMREEIKSVFTFSLSPFPVPHALSSPRLSPCPMPHALCPMLHTLQIARQHLNRSLSCFSPAELVGSCEAEECAGESVSLSQR